MPVDRAARDRLASTLAAYLRGEADNFALDDAGLGAKTADNTVRRIACGLWFAYDDCKRHLVSATPEGWHAMRRTIAFLKSDLELPEDHCRLRWLHPWQLVSVLSATVIAFSIVAAWRGSNLWLLLPGLLIGAPYMMSVEFLDRDEGSRPWYPFRDESQWRAHEHLLASERLPPYDPQLHDRPIRGRFVSALGYVLGIFFYAPLLSLAFLLPRRMHEQG